MTPAVGWAMQPVMIRVPGAVHVAELVAGGLGGVHVVELGRDLPDNGDVTGASGRREDATSEADDSDDGHEKREPDMCAHWSTPWVDELDHPGLRAQGVASGTYPLTPRPGRGSRRPMFRRAGSEGPSGRLTRRTLVARMNRSSGDQHCAAKPISTVETGWTCEPSASATISTNLSSGGCCLRPRG